MVTVYGSEGSRAAYVARINRVIDYVNAHLDEDLALAALARVACFSPFHFHRIFKAMMGETLSDYIIRLRLERAAGMLAFNAATPVTEIALDCGFASSAHFARAFKNRFGLSASSYRRERRRDIGQTNSNAGQEDRKKREDAAAGVAYNAPSERSMATLTEEENEVKVEIKKLPPYRVAYMRHIGGYGTPSLSAMWGRFARWAAASGLATPDAVWLGASHDDPDVTPADKCRYDACVTVGTSFKGSGEVGVTDLPGGTYAVYDWEGYIKDIKQGWDELCRWFPDSGFEPESSPCLEIYRHEDEDPSRKWLVRLCIPVKPL